MGSARGCPVPACSQHPSRDRPSALSRLTQRAQWVAHPRVWGLSPHHWHPFPPQDMPWPSALWLTLAALLCFRSGEFCVGACSSHPSGKGVLLPSSWPEFPGWLGHTVCHWEQVPEAGLGLPRPRPSVQD